MEQNQSDHLSNLGLELDGESRQSLHDSAKWTRFLSILVFIFGAIMLLFGIVGGARMLSAIEELSSAYRNISGLSGFILVFVILVVAIMFTVNYFLFRYAQKMKSALATENSQDFLLSLGSMKTYFVITTVLSGLALLLNFIGLFAN